MSGPPLVPVVITGFGVVSAYGLGTAGLESALEAGRPLLSEIDRSAGYHHADPSARLALRAATQNLTPWLLPGEARRMSPPSKLAVTAARQALAMAGLASPEGRVAAEPESDPDGDRPGGQATAVVLANSFGPSSFTEHLMRQILLENPEAASPFYFTECVANAPAAQIAIAAHARGANVTVVQREAGPLLAVAKGAAEVASGRARRALVGAAEEMTPLLHSFLDRFGALSRGLRGMDGEGEVARPFDRCRDGFLAAEGAVVWVLEREADALARGAVPLARVAGWASAFDPTAPPTDWGQGGPALARGLVRGLARFGQVPSAIDRIVSGASGAVAGDRLEAAVLRSAWQDESLPPILAPKGVTGEYGGGHLAAALLAVRGTPLGPTAGFAEIDPELGLVPHDGRPLPPPCRVLATGLAAGGAATWLVLESVTEEMPKSMATGGAES